MASPKQVIRSAKAQLDVQEALAYYQVEAPHVADAFVNALERAVVHIQRAPGTGSPRYAIELDIPGIRFWLLSKFPYGLFYLEKDDQLLVIRLVHMARDIPASLR
jgi:toxin ParE1/3/4